MQRVTVGGDGAVSLDMKGAGSTRTAPGSRTGTEGRASPGQPAAHIASTYSLIAAATPRAHTSDRALARSAT
jgi:hypothetical protein